MNLLIETLNAWAEHALRFAWPMLWQSSLLIGLLFALDLLMRRKVRPAVRYSLWLVVLVKLVLPPSLAVPTSPGWWLRPARTVPAEPRRTTVVVTYGPSESPVFPVAAPPVFVAPPRPHLLPAAWAFVGVVTVGVGLLAWMLWRWHQVARDARRAAVAPAQLSALLPELRSPVRLRLTDHPNSPAVCGLIRPVVLLPRSLAEHLPPLQLRAVLLHELLHLRRGDVWVNCAQALLQVAYWWHPLLWFANARIRRLREEAVDDAVMLALNEDAGAYVPTLLEVARLALHRPLATLGLIGILESRSSLRQRIERLMDFRPPRRAGLTLGSALAVLGFAALAVPMGEAPAPSEATQLARHHLSTNEVAPDGLSNSEMRADHQPLYVRTFKIDEDTLVKGLHLPMRPGATNRLEGIYQALPDYLSQAGVDLDPVRNPGKSMFYTHSVGALLVRATLEDLDVIEQKIAALRIAAGNEPAPGIVPESLSRPATTNGPVPNGLSKPGLTAETKIKAATLRQDGKLLFEMGKLDEAEAKLKLALKEDPNNQTVLYYLNLVSKAKFDRTARSVQNPRTETNLVHTGQGRHAIITKLDRIRLDRISFDRLPLREVVRSLAGEAQKRDPDKLGVNIILESSKGEAAIDYVAPSAASPTPATPAEVDTSTVPITIEPPLTNVRLGDVLDAIVKVAALPIKYSIEDYAVVFSARIREATPLYIRTFKVDPDTFYWALQGEGAVSSWKTFELPASNTGGAGFRFIHSNDRASEVSSAARNYFEKLGANLDPVANPGKSVFFNDRQGMLLVRATLQDLDIIEAGIAVLNNPPPQVNIKVKFVEVPQDDTKALGFDWYLGNVMMTNGAVSGPAGTVTSNALSPTATNPIGVFPGNPPVASPTNIASGSTNQILTFGLRNSSTSPSTINGILTDPQFRVLMKALQQRSGSELLAQPEVTTLSGRQAQMKTVDVKTVVKGIHQQALTPPGITTSNEDESALYVSEPMEFGPVLDVIPTVLPDGYTIALTVIPTVTEFLGYQEGQTNRVAVYVNGKKKWVIPPEPIVRQQQMTTSVRVWDGQTVVLGGLTSETVNILKDKVPLLGDLPLVGRLFRSESKAVNKKNLLIFVTPTLIDAAGNRIHTADELPSARNTVPPQPAR